MPPVSVVCLCYNHAAYVEEAIKSVRSQSYKNVELIVVDDRSTDNSVEVINKIVNADSSIKFISNVSNLGNCRAFNLGFQKTSGAFIIDLAADDVLNPDRIEKGVQLFQKMGEHYGVHFSDAELIDENGKHLGYHSDRFPHNTIPQGDVYPTVLSKYFINSPTMMIRRSVFDKIGGYDESLAYEDFDFWVRSSREFLYGYTPEALIKRRVLKDSLGSKQYKRGSAQLWSTLMVCKKAMLLNKTSDENKALAKRVRYEIKRAGALRELGMASQYFDLLLKIPTA